MPIALAENYEESDHLDEFQIPDGDAVLPWPVEEWEQALYEAAVEIVRRRISEPQFRIFQLVVREGLPAEEAAKIVGSSLNAVYLAKSRVSQLVENVAEMLKKKHEHEESVPCE